MERVANGDCVVLDVRRRGGVRGEPPGECPLDATGGARATPRELPHDRPIVAYCRGPYCVLAVNAVETLRRHGFDAVRAPEGVQDWREPWACR